MLPVAPEDVIPPVDPMPKVALEFKVKVGPVIVAIPQFNVPLLSTAKARLVPTMILLLSVSEAPLFTVQSMEVFVSVPEDCMNILFEPVKFTESPLALPTFAAKVPPV